MDIKEIGNIIMHIKGIHGKNSIGHSINEEDSQRKAPGNNINGPGTTNATDQPIQSNPATAEWSVKNN